MEPLSRIKEKLLKLDLTFLPTKVLENFRRSIENVERDDVPGDIIETGVWKGGACIYAYYTLKHLRSKRKLYLADSFEGHARPDGTYPEDEDGPKNWNFQYFKVSLEQVKKNFERFGPIDDSLVFVKGFFSDTIPNLKIGPIAVLRLDGDNYEPTIVVLEHLYPKLSVGGYCIIDDWGHKRAKKAIVDYRKANDITEEIIIIDKTPGAYPSAFWKKVRP